MDKEELEPQENEEEENTADSEEEAASSGSSEISPAKLVELISATPEAQEIISSQVTSAVQRARAEELARETQRKNEEELATLVREGRYDEIGRRMVEEDTRRKATATIKSEVLSSEYERIYSELFSQPELQKLTKEEQAELDPRRFATDAAYVVRLSTFVANKRAGLDLEKTVSKRVAEEREAEKNRAAAAANKTSSPSGTPAAVASGSPAGKTSADLIREGFRATFGVAD